jgi:hypothetical protein
MVIEQMVIVGGGERFYTLCGWRWVFAIELLDKLVGVDVSREVPSCHVLQRNPST